MNTAKHLPVLARVDTAVLGATTQAVERAVTLSEAGRSVILIAQETCLATECALTLSFPAEETPDQILRALEARCLQSGVQLLYMAWILDQQPDGAGSTLLRVGGKFGVAAIVAASVEDYRTAYTDERYSAYLIGRDDPQKVQIFTVEQAEGAGAPLPQRLLTARLNLIEQYRARGLAASWRLGRFAVRGLGTRPLPQAFSRDVTYHVEAAMDPIREHIDPVLPWEPAFSGREIEWDVVVVGGGTAGAMAALAAARHGKRVAVVEPNYALGGTSTVGGVSAYWFGARYCDTQEIDDLVRELTDPLDRPALPGIWGQVDNWNPDIKATALLQALLQAGVSVFFGHIAFGVWREGGQVAGVAVAGERGISFFRAAYLLDATGDGDVAVFAGARAEYGNGRDGVTYWASLAQYPTAGTYQNNFSTMMVASDPLDYTRFIVNARKFGHNLFDHGRYAAMRESRHVRGIQHLTLRDLMTYTHFENTLYTCYSNYDPKGKVTADIIYCGALPQQTVIEIPLGALCPVNEQGMRVEGIYVLGKAISASHDLFPSIRMQKDLMHQGAVMGNLVADCLNLGVRPEALDPETLRTLLARYSNDPRQALRGKRLSLEACAAALDAAPRSHWVDADFRAVEESYQPYLALLCAPASEALEPIQAELAKTTEKSRRLTLLRLALWHGDETHLEEFLAHIESQLAGRTLPRRSGATTCAQMLPDHGVMPEVVYDLNLLAYTSGKGCGSVFRRVYQLLLETERDYFDVGQGIFPYVECFAFVAERGGFQVVLELAEELMKLPELISAEDLPNGDLRKERLLLLRYLLARALAANGWRRGYRELAALTSLSVRAIALCAAQQLRRLSGACFGLSRDAWLGWINNCDTFPCDRIQEKTF